LLLQFLDADAVTIYHLLDDNEVRRSAAITRGSEEGGAVPLNDLSRLSRLGDEPLWHECIVGQKTVQRCQDGGRSRVVFPIANERGVVVGMIEIETAVSLQLRETTLVDGILRILRNHRALLDYSESDTLTGLLNRKTFDSRFDKFREASGVVSKDEPSWLGIVDIDKFKSINDSFGHLFGDEILILTARLLKNAFRGADQLFRFGGEEFIVVLDRATNQGAQIAFNRLRTSVEEFQFPQVGRVTISLGYTRIDPQDGPSNCVERADAALYYAKHHGRNSVQHYETLIAAGELDAKTSGAHDIELF
jgi:diguanylate cyclase (GGDEF)-like protein